jgi:hypothetical protein
MSIARASQAKRIRGRAMRRVMRGAGMPKTPENQGII